MWFSRLHIATKGILVFVVKYSKSGNFDQTVNGKGEGGYPIKNFEPKCFSWTTRSGGVVNGIKGEENEKGLH